MGSLVDTIPFGKFVNNDPEKGIDHINCIIEIPKGQTQKYEYNEDYGVFEINRVLASSTPYPNSYGFLPRTIGPDYDPLDVIIYSSLPIDRGTLVRARVMGALDMYDGEYRDPKIVAVPLYNEHKYNSLDDLDIVVLKQAKLFFEMYKEGVTVKGYIGKEAADEIVISSSERYINYRGLKH